jgi:hypothetical protein
VEIKRKDDGHLKGDDEGKKEERNKKFRSERAALVWFSTSVIWKKKSATLLGQEFSYEWDRQPYILSIE